ncbi:hypothetical protein LN650_11665 [Klebsiella pneumoniae subsp. pneumoniae]|nr:hypothetical protein [Klebsiella pneumoniae subsp. pneumoniae]
MQKLSGGETQPRTAGPRPAQPSAAAGAG